MFISSALTRIVARAGRFVTAREPTLRSFALGGDGPLSGECRNDAVVLGIFGGVGALVVGASVAMMALRYFGA